MKWEATPENTNEKCENEPCWGKKKEGSGDEELRQGGRRSNHENC